MAEDGVKVQMARGGCSHDAPINQGGDDLRALI